MLLMPLGSFLRKWWENLSNGTIFSVFTFMAAAVLSYVISLVFTSTNAILFGMTVCLVILGFMIHRRNQIINEQSKSIIDQLGEIKNIVGIKVRYIERESSQAVLFHEARKLVERAERTISVVLSFQDEGHHRADPEAVHERELYYDAMVKKAENSKVVYSRFLQTGSGAEADPIYLTHFHKMLELKEKKPKSVRLIEVPARRPLSFVLIDDELLLVQMDAKDESGRTYMHGAFIFEDPQHLITKFFREFLDDISSEHLKAIQRNDLKPLYQDPSPGV